MKKSSDNDTIPSDINKRINEFITQFRSKPIYLPINKQELENVVEKLFSQMFPICEIPDNNQSEAELLLIYKILLSNFSRLMEADKAEKIIIDFFTKISSIQQRLYNDAKTFLAHDPAAESLEEIVLTYPGFFALSVHRIAHEFYKMQVPIIPRLFSEYAHAKVGVDIHPGAKIGDNFFLDHGTGTVIGETTIIGNNVKIYQGVTLGALFVTKNLSKVKRHPTVEDNVVIYAGATILGGETSIGHDSVIGGNVWLTHSVEPYTLAYYSSEMKIKTIKDFKEPLNFII
ncbi:serine O-acetyltransferase EpsC [Apibacter sp. HY039]|uniref:serine O-acetyltransferase EpsC n=1 Tax=Apibacter sp. HY039 TaxID=2501476 RepID=UPI000FEB7B5C|nr:serine O-acetyltransferase EpsC [Apibacter sp. HY039]